MPVRSNSFYNDPMLGAAFENLAAALGPPSAGEMNAYTSAKAKREEAARIAWLFYHSSDPTASARAAVTGVQAYGNTPAGFAADDATKRYGYDRQYDALRSNNTADNARALEERRLQEAGLLTRQNNEPISVAEGGTVYLPGQRVQATGLPAILGGTVKAGEGDTVVTPDGRTIMGTPKPMTTDQLTAAIMGTAPPKAQQNWAARDIPIETITGADGQPMIVSRPQAIGERPYSEPKPMTTDQLVAQIMGGAPPEAQRAWATRDMPIETVIGPDGKPVVVSRPQAIGQQPFVKPDAGAKPTNALAVLADGTRVPAIQGPAGKWVHAQTGEPLPNDIQVFDMPRPQGSAQDVGLGKQTEASDRAGIFFSRAAPASANMDDALNGGYVPADLDYEFSLGALSGAPNAISNRAVSDAGRRFYSNAQNFMMAVLRPDTGAAFGKEEFQAYAKVFIPMPGDDPKTVAGKSAARQTALAALQGTSRGAAESIAQILSRQGLFVPPEMAKVIAEGGVMGRAARAGGGAPTTPVASAPVATPNSSVTDGVAPTPAGRVLRFDAQGNLLK